MPGESLLRVSKTVGKGRHPRALVAMDKFRGTASASDLAATIAASLERRGWEVKVQAISDGGEGFRACFEGRVSYVDASDAYGTIRAVPITWLREGSERIAVIEVAEIVGRRIAKPSSEEALRASSAGLGQVILAAHAAGATGVLVGLGGSATSDGGEACYDLLRDGAALPITAATDVMLPFFGAMHFAVQKGIQVKDEPVLEARLAMVAERYRNECGVDVAAIDGAGAAGGIGGALVARGATLAQGFDVIARHLNLASDVHWADLVITGEGRLDQGSLEGKVVDGVGALLGETPGLVLCGASEASARATLLQRYPSYEVLSLSEECGERALRDPLGCIADLLAISNNDREELGPGHH